MAPAGQWTHTPIGTPLAVVVLCVVEADVTDTIGAVTYGGIPMSEVLGSPLLRDGTEDGAVQMFVLLADVPAGERTVSVTNTGSTDRQCLVRTFTAAASVSGGRDRHDQHVGRLHDLEHARPGGAAAVVMEAGFTHIGRRLLGREFRSGVDRRRRYYGSHDCAA